MNINKVSNNAAIQAYQNKLGVDVKGKVQNQVKEEKSSIEESGVKVTLTTKTIANEIIQSQNVESVKDVSRQARLDEIANQIKNNTFKVNPEAIANKMMQDKDMVKYLLGM